MDPIERYATLIDDVTAFRDACARPLPSVVRVNTIKSSIERAQDALEDANINYDPVEWHSGLFKLTTNRPGTSWPYFHGWLHGQEEVSVLPALAVDPDPGEVIWDACAAPGSKTTQLAALMDDTGILIGNDNNLGRLSALRHNAERLGVTNLAVTNQDARNFSFKPFGDRTEKTNRIEAFDHALVDAPCSCEGTIRKNPDAFEQWSYEHVMSVVAIQKAILRRAVQATRPGGTVVYSTCTFAPEENEGVVNHVLESESCRVVSWNPPADFKTIPGITQWHETEYDSSMELTHRVYPHHNDTGGFFCAKLEVTA